MPPFLVSVIRALAYIVLIVAILDTALASIYAYLGWLDRRDLEAKHPPFDPAALRPGDVLVFRTPGRVGKAIRRLTWSGWNHAAVYIGHGIVAEATPSSGVVLTAVSEYAGTPTLASTFPLSPAERSAVVKFVLSTVGKYRYGWLDDLALGLGRLGLRPRLLDDYARNDHRLCCSQLASYAYAAAGCDGWLSGTGSSPVGEREPWYTVPGDIATAILTYVPR